ncbi:MAG TPA: hypothetical protein PKE45_17095, partial [Caldilineaceae bacterium]|nr:hypothetical protein [Caldilineaceae bacterium]
AARGWLAWRRRHPARSGRLLYGGVLPAWRGQGIGGQLWGAVQHFARQQGWQSLTIGPVRRASPAACFLTRRGAERRQRYVVYGAEV